MKMYYPMNKDNALAILKDIKKCLKNTKWFLLCGTLLGAVREKDFIDKDFDIDLGILAETIIPREKEILIRFRKKGFEIPDITFTIYGVEIDLKRDGININIDYHYLKDDKRYRLLGLWVNARCRLFMDKSFFENLEEGEIRGEKFPIPSNSEEFLRLCYGDWQTPHLAGTGKLSIETYRRNEIKNGEDITI